MLYPRGYTFGIFTASPRRSLRYLLLEESSGFLLELNSNKIFLSRKLNKFVYDNMIIQATLSFM